MKNKGFTLLEILIALFIFTIVSVILTGALHRIFDIQIRTQYRATRLSQLQITLLLISRDIEQIIDRPITNAKGIKESAFFGTSDSMTFTHTGLANPKGQLQRSTLQRAHYFLSKEKLVRETWQVLDQSAKSQSDLRGLAPIEELQLSYLDEKGIFHPQWPPSNLGTISQPRGIRMSLVLPNWGKITQLYLIPGQPNAQTP